MISPEMSYASITSILIITFSIILYLSIRKLTKTYGLLIIDIKSKILELESITNLQVNKLKDLENKTNEITDEIEKLSLKLYGIENILYNKKPLEARKQRKLEEPIEKTIKEKLKLNNTEKTIINLLKEGPKTTREIKNMLNLSREHVARELKHLYDIGLVKRHIDTKPFTYEINLEKVSEIE